MADNSSPNVYYLETDCPGSKDKCIESPLPIALDVIANGQLILLWIWLIFAQNFLNMGAIVIKADNRSSKILKELAEQLGAQVTDIKNDQYEDFLLGQIMDSEKTGKTVSRSKIFNKLSSKWLSNLINRLKNGFPIFLRRSF